MLIMSGFHGHLPDITIESPKIVGYYSVNKHGEYYPGAEQLKYLNWHALQNQKNIHFDLNEGIELAIECGEEYMYKFYHYLGANPSMVHDFSAGTLKRVGFICNRNTLKTISNIPYESEEVKIAAFLFQGNIFLYVLKTEQARTEYNVRASHWGFKFEQFMLSDSPFKKPETDSPVKEGEALNCLFQIKIGGNNILYNAEIDGILYENNSQGTLNTNEKKKKDVIKFLQKSKLVELKTSMQKFDHKLFNDVKSRNIWLQSYFGKVESIVIGYRTREGHVYDIKKYNIDEMKNRGKGNWSSKTCLNYCDKFLTFVKDCFAKKIILKSGEDIRDVPQMELFFTKMRNSSRISCEGSTDIVRPYLSEWFLRDIDQNGEK